MPCMPECGRIGIGNLNSLLASVVNPTRLPKAAVVCEDRETSSSVSERMFVKFYLKSNAAQTANNSSTNPEMEEAANS